MLDRNLGAKETMMRPYFVTCWVLALCCAVKSAAFTIVHKDLFALLLWLSSMVCVVIPLIAALLMQHIAPSKDE